MKLTDKKITGKSAIGFIGKNFLYFGIAILVIFTAIQKPEFLSAIPLNLINRTAAYVMMALGMGGIMFIGAGTDLSAGRVMGITSLVLASFFGKPDGNHYLLESLFPGSGPIPIFVGFLMAIILGMIIGAFNGFFVGKFKLPAFIVTLSTQLMIYGTMLSYMGWIHYRTNNISTLTDKYRDLISNATVTDWFDLPFSIPNYVWYAILVVVLMWIVWKYTPLGKNMRFVGSNREAAKAMNVNVFATTMIVFAMAGALYGLNGFIEAARVGGPGASTGANAEITAIIACLLGGVSLKGGIGKIGGIVVGVILVQLVTVCLQWLSVSANYIYIIMGGILILAVIMDSLKHCYKNDKKPE